jgi:hypothetical protein
MLHTYTLYLIGRDGERRFEPVLCADVIELLRRAREEIARDASLGGVEARFGDQVLFILNA